MAELTEVNTAELSVSTEAATAEQKQAADNPWLRLFSTEKLLSMGILTTRIGFVLILLLCIMMQGQHFYHFVVLFFLTFGLNCSLI